MNSINSGTPASKLLRLVRDDKGIEQQMCLCGRGSIHEKREGCTIVYPGTPWWNALHEAEPGDDPISVTLPGGRVVTVEVLSVEEVSDETGSIAA